MRYLADVFLFMLCLAGCASGPEAETAPISMIPDSSCVDAAAEIPGEVNQYGALVGQIVLANRTDEPCVFGGAIDVWGGSLRVEVETPDGRVVRIPGCEGLTVEPNPAYRRNIPPNGVVVIPIYAVKVCGEFLFQDSGPCEVRIEVPAFDLVETRQVYVKPCSDDAKHREYFEKRRQSIISPYSEPIDDEDLLRLDEFSGVGRLEVARYLEWMYGGTTTYLMIQGQSDEESEYPERFRRRLKLSFDELDALSPDLGFWALYNSDGSPKDSAQLLYVD